MLPAALPVALVVLRDTAERADVASRLARRGWSVVACATVGDALSSLDDEARIDAVLVDDRLEDGVARDVLAHVARREPFPFVAVVGTAALPAAEAFSLAHAGARELLERPLDEEALRRALPRESVPPPPLDPVVRAYVGRIDLSELQRRVRRTALRQALVLASGSRSGAARMLRVTRQAVQHMLRNDDPG